MSTEIADIKGVKEIDYSDKIEKEDTYLNLTRFYGGEKNGAMLQLTVCNSQGYIQLTQDQVVELATILLNSFDTNIYPSD